MHKTTFVLIDETRQNYFTKNYDVKTYQLCDTRGEQKYRGGAAAEIMSSIHLTNFVWKAQIEKEYILDIISNGEGDDMA